jgi:TetR/AcrR family transcriptional repressor of mexJK operon
MVAQPVRGAPSGERARQKRQVIIRAAQKAFLREGFGVGMDALAAEAGVSKVTIYNHFGSKEALFTAVIGDALDDALQEALQRVEARLSTSKDLRRDLLDVCRDWVAGLSTPEMLALRNLVAGEQRRFPHLGLVWMESGPNRFHARIGEALQQLVEHGQLTIPDIELATLQLSGLVLSPHLVYSAYGSVIDHPVADRLIVAGIDMFLDYYRPGRKLQA